MERVVNALKQSKPYPVAFLDIRMLSIEDGIWVGEQIRLVFVTGYSDYAPEEIITRVLPPHKLLYIQVIRNYTDLVYYGLPRVTLIIVFIYLTISDKRM